MASEIPVGRIDDLPPPWRRREFTAYAAAEAVPFALEFMQPIAECKRWQL